MRHLVYIVTFPVVSISSSLLTITPYSSIITKFVYKNTDYSVPFMRLCQSSIPFISEFSPYSIVSDPKPFHVGFVVDRVALEYVTILIIPLSPTLNTRRPLEITPNQINPVRICKFWFSKIIFNTVVAPTVQVVSFVPRLLFETVSNCVMSSVRTAIRTY